MKLIQLSNCSVVVQNQDTIEMWVEAFPTAVYILIFQCASMILTLW